LNELFRVWKGKWPQKDRVKDAEDGGVGANAEGKSDDRYRGEPGIPAQHAEAESAKSWSKLSMKFVPRASRHLPWRAQGRQNSMRARRNASARGHATTYQIFGERLDVETQFRVHLVFHPRPPRHGAQPRPDSAPHGHYLPQPDGKLSLDNHRHHSYLSATIGIDSGRSARGKPGGKQRNDAQQERHTEK